MVKPTLNVNNVFKEQVEIIQRNISLKYHVRYNKCDEEKNTRVIALVMFYKCI